MGKLKEIAVELVRLKIASDASEGIPEGPNSEACELLDYVEDHFDEIVAALEAQGR